MTRARCFGCRHCCCSVAGHYIDKKCPFTGNVSIRGRILTGGQHSSRAAGCSGSSRVGCKTECTESQEASGVSASAVMHSMLRLPLKGSLAVVFLSAKSSSWAGWTLAVWLQPAQIQHWLDVHTQGNGAIVSCSVGAQRHARRPKHCSSRPFVAQLVSCLLSWRHQAVAARLQQVVARRLAEQTCTARLGCRAGVGIQVPVGLQLQRLS